MFSCRAMLLLFCSTSVTFATSCASSSPSRPASPTPSKRPVHLVDEVVAERPAGLPLELAPVDLDDVRAFMSEVESRSRDLSRAAEAAEARAIKGLPHLHEPLVEVARTSRDLATKFAVGNKLFGALPSVSRELHAEVLRGRPNDPMVQYEWALHLHRQGRCEEAVPYYRGAMRIMSEGSVPHGMLAQCLLQAGRVDEAITSMRHFDHRQHHTRIESLFEEVYRSMDPWTTRSDLLASARGGRLEAWVDVVMLDLFFRTDLWNEQPRRELLERDLPEAHAALAGRPEARAALDIVVPWVLGDMTDEAAALAVRKRFPAELPDDVRLSEQLLRARLSDPRFSGADALQVYGPSARRRYEAGDLSAARLLAALAAAAQDDALVEDLNERLCREHDLLRFCLDKARRMLLRGATIETTAEQLSRAWPNHPAGPSLRILANLRAGQTPSQDDLRRYLERVTYAMPRSYGWKGAFVLLASLRSAEEPPRALLHFLFDELENEIAFAMPCDPWDWPSLRAHPVCKHVVQTLDTPASSTPT